MQRSKNLERPASNPHQFYGRGVDCQNCEGRRGWRELERDLSKMVAIGSKPLHGLLESFQECMFRLKAKELLGPADIEAPSRLPIGFAGVPFDLPCKTGLCGNHGGKIANRDFFPCPQIDWETAFVVLSCAKDTFRGVLHIQELPSRRSVSPQCKRGLASLFGRHTFTN